MDPGAGSVQQTGKEISSLHTVKGMEARRVSEIEPSECSSEMESKDKCRRPSLRLEIPVKPTEPLEPLSSTSKKSVRTPSSGKNSRKSVQFHNSQAQTPRQFSLVRLLTPRLKRTLSFPLRADVREPKEPPKEKQIKRSKSGPLDVQPREKKLTRLPSGSYLVKLATPRPRESETQDFNESGGEKDVQEDDEEIPEEDAVCRICLSDLAEEGKTMKLECSCKGELALAHEECALKWFGIRGNRECDVCGQVVENLPVTLVRVQLSATAATEPVHLQQQLDVGRLDAMRRVWHDIPVLVMISMLTYFCLLEQLLVKRKGPRALVLALPFSVMFGMLTAVSATTLVKRRCMWFFSFFQLGFVIMFAHMFYSWFKLIPVLAISLAGFAGFGLSMVLNALAMECWSCTRRRVRRNEQATTPIVDQTRDIEQGPA